MATEAWLTKKATEECERVMRFCVVLKHADKATSGHPDSSITWNDRTLWVEFKHANPNFDSPGIQQLTCQRLEIHGRCIYVIFDTPRNCITILSPKKLGQWPLAGISCAGFNFHWLALEIQKRLQ